MAVETVVNMFGETVTLCAHCGQNPIVAHGWNCPVGPEAKLPAFLRRQVEIGIGPNATGAQRSCADEASLRLSRMISAGGRQGGKTSATIDELGRQLVEARYEAEERRQIIVKVRVYVDDQQARITALNTEITALRAELAHAKQSQAPSQPNPKTDPICQPSDNPLARRFRGGVGQAFEDRP